MTLKKTKPKEYSPELEQLFGYISKWAYRHVAQYYTFDDLFAAVWTESKKHTLEAGIVLLPEEIAQTALNVARWSWENRDELMFSQHKSKKAGWRNYL